MLRSFGLLMICFFSVSASQPVVDEHDAIKELLEIEARRHFNHPFLAQALTHPSKRVVKQAIRTIGRIGDVQLVSDLLPLLDHQDSDVRYRTVAALAQLPAEDSKLALRQRFIVEHSPEVKGRILKSLGQQNDQQAFSLIEDVVLNETRDDLVAGACEGLGYLLRVGSLDLSEELVTKLLRLLRYPEPRSVACGFVLQNVGSDHPALTGARLREAFRRTRSNETKALVLGLFGAELTSADLRFLSKQAKSRLAGIRIAALKAIGKAPVSSEMLDILVGAFSDLYPAVVSTALDELAQLGRNAALRSLAIEDLIRRTNSRWIAERALRTLAIVEPWRADPWIKLALASRDQQIVVMGIKALGENITDSVYHQFVSYLTSEEHAFAGAAASMLHKLPEEFVNERTISALKMALDFEDAAMTYYVAEFVKMKNITELAPVLADTLEKLNRTEYMEAKVAILQALAVIGGEEQLDAVDAHIASRFWQVSQAAARTHQAITGEDVSDQARKYSSLEFLTPSLTEIDRALGASVVLETTKGVIVLHMLDEAPFAATNFINLIQQGFYSGTSFHRLVSNFVIQGGDPLGQGFGGPGYFIPDEPADFVRHKRGIVGMATAGKDSGGSQFFVNLTTNLHLDGHYTAFAKVIDGMEVVDQLVPSDRIIRAWVSNY